MNLFLTHLRSAIRVSRIFADTRISGRHTHTHTERERKEERVSMIGQVLISSSSLSSMKTFKVVAVRRNDHNKRYRRRLDIKSGGWFENNKDIEGRDETFKRQQEILQKRRKGGRIDEEVNKRRAKVSGFLKGTLSKTEMDAIKKKNTDAANALSKEAVKGGIPLPMASFGMPSFDGGERFDLRGKYANEGWVDPKDLEKQKAKQQQKAQKKFSWNPFAK
jgi:hypothetical protein